MSEPETRAVPAPHHRTRALTRKMARVARMEFRMTTANRAFVVITIIGPFLIVAMSVLPGLLAMNGGGVSTSRVAFVGNRPLEAALAPVLAGSSVEEVDPATLGVDASTPDEASLQAALRNRSIDAYVILPEDETSARSIRLVSAKSASLGLISTLENMIGRVIVARRLAAAGFDAARVTELTQPPQLDVRRLDANGERQQADTSTLLFTALAFTFMLYMTILLYGQSIGTSVLREKRSKTVEIMLSSLSPPELLVGKIAGKAVASLLQYAIWIVMSMLVLQVLSPLVNVHVSLAGGTTTYVYLVVFFLLAFFLYSSIYAALGAAAEDEQHLSQLAWPVIFFLVAPMVLIGAIATNADGVLPRILAIFPLTAPIVMFQRLVIGSPAPWEVVLSVGLLIATIVAVALLAAKIFRVGILMTGKRFSIGEVLRWLRYRR